MGNEERENEIRFTVYVNTYGHKDKCVRDVGQRMARLLYHEFGDRFHMTDHRSRPVLWDKNAHDWGFGEA